MKVIVCGAGQVGFSIARYLAQEDNDVTVIDQSQQLTRKISDTLDIKTVNGFASHPEILEQAGADAADMLIAVTHADEVNMIACQIGHSLFNITTKIARVRQQGYLEPKWANLYSRDHMPIDVIISPEREVAGAIARRLRMPGAFDLISLVGDRVKLAGVRLHADCPVVNTPLRQLTQLFPELNVRIVGIVRAGVSLPPVGDEQLMPGDEVYFVSDSDHLDRAMTAFGHEEREARRIVVFGGGNIGQFLTQQIEAENPSVNIKIVEKDKSRAEIAARNLKRSVVLQGDVLDSEILTEANVASAEAVVSVTNDDETNILSALLAKRQGSARAICLVNSETYAPLTPDLGIDVVVSPRHITVSTILQHVRRGRIHSVHTLRDGFGELIEAEALETSPLVGQPLGESDLPEGVLVGAVVHDGEVVIPRASTVIQTGDRVVLFAPAESVRQVEKMFAVQLEFF
ncbi:MAG: Trk system potassium transporter TrkA [Rhodospirillales bacterium]|mgnify:CR=1 FL=1|jgi:trk system potassium uptake protein TrkA|nr:Trk system potassium transporter TrkA [Rhodospirillaceae bacterium]MDP6429185.1 Trk system potassium transporter TrkA [Rhodospirillales bacterium]MDP6644100.1 Trk system potassium transporter TrkA [Rhodospirillales bacterium]MDP6841152.1 Trk system potassium transporter TrkA [Rhodospirillales bacterium]|tara:strand:+ start:79 stop:1455 length:1377 start_codon:yes stop_codon:yes gene_type:complete